MDRYFTSDLCSLSLQKSIPSNTLFASTVCRYCHQISKSNASYFWVNNGNHDEGITFKCWCQWLTSAMHIMNIGIEFVGWCLFFFEIFIIKGNTYENQLQMTSMWTVSRAKLITDTMQHCSEFMNEWYCHWVDKQGHLWQEIFSVVYGLKHVKYLQCSSRDMTNFALHINLRPKISKFCWEVQSIRWQLSLLKSFSSMWLCSIVLWCHLPSQIWNYNPLLT